MEKLSLDKALIRAKSHINKNEISEAKKLYQAVLLAFPQNIIARQGLATLSNQRQDNIIQTPFEEALKELLNLYNRGQLASVVEQAQILIKQYPQAFIIWNFLGAANKGLGQVEKASEAFKKVTELNPNYADGFNNLGVTFKDQRKFDEAIEAYKKALLLKPDYAEAYNNMGIALKEQEKLDEAIEAYKKAILLKPDDAETYYNMGATFKDQRKFDEAIEAYKKALLLKPDYAEAYNNMGVALIEQDKLGDAIEAYKKALLLKPDYAEAYNNMGIALKEQEKLDEAIEAYKKALLLKPNYAEVYHNIGLTLKDQDKLEEAIEAYNKALSLKPDYAQVYNNIGNVFKIKGNFNESFEAYNRALSLKPDYAEVYNNIGNLFKNKGKLIESLDAYYKAVSLKPNYAEAYNNMGLNLKDQGKLKESLKSYQKALSIKYNFPEAHQNMGFTLLNSGKVKEGLDEYEWRLKTADFIQHQRLFSKPKWDGEKSLHDKTILLWSEQGIGDTIRWSSCLSLLIAKAKLCILECEEKLVPLLKRSFPKMLIKPINKTSDHNRDDFDFHLPMGSLYKNFLDQNKVNAKVTSHLIPNAKRVSFWKERLNTLGKGPFVGIGWKSSNKSPDKLPNNALVTELAPIFKIPDITFINLQYFDFKNDLTIIKNKFDVKVHNFDDLDHFHNIDDVAALCAALDAVISTKMTVPIVSGGVGTPTKIANYRQSSCNNILLNPLNSSVDIFERNIWEPWNKVFQLIAKDIFKLKNEIKSIK